MCGSNAKNTQPGTRETSPVPGCFLFMCDVYYEMNDCHFPDRPFVMMILLMNTFSMLSFILMYNFQIINGEGILRVSDPGFWKFYGNYQRGVVR